MRKLITQLIKALPLLALVLSLTAVNAQRLTAPRVLQDFETSIHNVIVTTTGTSANRQFSFDLYLLDTDPANQFVLAGYQAGVYVDPSIFPAGAAVTAVIFNNATYSQLVPAQQPTAIQYDPAVSSINLAGRTPPGPGTPTDEFSYTPSGTIIGTTSFGTRICRIRVTSSVVFTPNSLANLFFNSSSVVVPNYATRVAHYDDTNATIVWDPDQEAWVWGDPPINTQLDVIPGAVGAPGTNAHVYENPILNPATCTNALPFAVTGSGSYCAGDPGLEVGLAGSQVGVSYTLNPGGDVVAGTGAAISFGFKPAGTYTVSGIGTIPTICAVTVPMTGSAIVTETPVSTVVFNESACDTYTWPLNGMTYTASGTYTYVVGCVTNTLNLTITPSSTVLETVVALNSYFWAVNGVTYTVSGIYTYVDGCVTYTLDLTINTVVPCPESTWTGLVDNDWFNLGNWNPCVPQEITVVTIPGGCPNYPTIVAPPVNSVACLVTITDLHLLDGASLIGQQYICVTNPAVVDRSIVNSNFHLLSSPVAATTFGDVFLPAYWFEVYAREYDELTGNWINKTIADNLNVGQGYSVQMTTPQTAAFTGLLNSSDVTRTLSNVNPGGNLNYVGWNLLGNPFTSAIDWDVFSSGAYDAQVAVWDQAGAGNYIYWNGSVGSLTNGIIPAQNGFFVKTSTNGASITIPLAAQLHSSQAFYKESVANALQLRADGNNYFDATFVHFNDNATVGFDSNYDAFKLEGLETAPQFFNMAAGYKLSINELPFEGNEVVDLGFTCGVAGTYNVTASGMESFSGSTPILLEDLKLNILQDLRLNPVYSFNYTTSDNVNRFKLHFKNATGINDPINNGISVYSYDHTVVINNTTTLAGEVRIFDMAGRELKAATMNGNGTTSIPMLSAVGTYIVKVTNAQGTVNQKVFIK